MKIYSNKNVYEAALERINYIFDEFPEVIASFSGGKDSTVVLNLALQVAEARGRLPLKVLFLDQEAEWDMVIDYVRQVMYDPRVEPLWLQVPIKLFNSTSLTDHWLNCWEVGKESEWIREKEPVSIKENKYGTDRFKELFSKFTEVEFKDKKVAYLAGVRAEESPSRYTALTSTTKYNHITWCRRLSDHEKHFTFYPLYDWSYTDIWKSIHDNKWAYCKLYDYMYRYGIPVKEMRVSNVHHETAVKSLYFLQEIEADLWNRLTKRLKGINTAGHLKEDSFTPPKTLPYMFSGWKEYRDHLVDKLLQSEEAKTKFRKHFEGMDERYNGMNFIDDMYRAQIAAILANDYYFTKLGTWENRPDIMNFRNFKRGVFHQQTLKNRYITG